MMEITPLGDSALILRLPEDCKDKPEQTLNKVLGVMEAIERAQIPGLIECVSAYTTVAVFFDPAGVIRSGAAPESVVDWLAEKIRAQEHLSPAPFLLRRGLQFSPRLDVF